jgi:hypothetical protein
MAAESSTERRILVRSMRQALWAQPALLVRGSSRRITIMRFRPANIRVINRRDDRLGRRPHCFPLAREEQRKPTPRMYLTGSSISERQSTVPRGGLQSCDNRHASPDNDHVFCYVAGGAGTWLPVAINIFDSAGIL